MDENKKEKKGNFIILDITIEINPMRLINGPHNLSSMKE